MMLEEIVIEESWDSNDSKDFETRKAMAT